jgi:hypothetical protein
MKNKLNYVLLAFLLLAGSSVFAMDENEGVSGRDFHISKSTVIRLLNSNDTLEVGGHHYKVTGTVVGTAGDMFTQSPERMIRFYNGWTYDKAPTAWQYLEDLPPTLDENPGSPTFGQYLGGGDGVADLRITRVD